MSYEVELAVELLIPDNVAFTALNTLKREVKIEKLKRADYYRFTLPDSIECEYVRKRIVKVDILVNANKHKARVLRPGSRDKDCFTVEHQCP